MIFTISCSCCGSFNELRCLCSNLSEDVSQLLGDFLVLIFGLLMAVGGRSSLPLSLLESEPLESFLGFFGSGGFPVLWLGLVGCFFLGGPATDPPALTSFRSNSSLGFWKVRHSLLIWLIGGSFRFGRRRSYSNLTFFGSSLLRKYTSTGRLKLPYPDSDTWYGGSFTTAEKMRKEGSENRYVEILITNTSMIVA